MNSNEKNDRLAALRAQMQKDSQRGFDGRKDREDFWQTRMGKSTVRLIQHPSDESPVITYYNHAFKEKEWFIEDCPVTIGQLCPVCEAGQKGHERKNYYVANVFVPDTGAILWWKFGTLLFSQDTPKPNQQLECDWDQSMSVPAKNAFIVQDIRSQNIRSAAGRVQ